MPDGISTLIVEPRFLVREGLALLMGSLAYRVVSIAGTAADISESTAVDGHKLVILGALSAEDAASEAMIIRQVWPDSKIVLLLDTVSSGDLQKLSDAPIDGCVPLHVSGATLNSALHLIIVQGLRVMIFGDKKPSFTQRGEEDGHANGAAKSVSNNTFRAMAPLVQEVLQPVPAQASVATFPGTSFGLRVGSDAFSLRKPSLSERETQILDGLVHGHANKVIARTCDISEATVKVHMKSILRKIQVANRTQAAIWALEHGYCGDRDMAAGVTPS